MNKLNADQADCARSILGGQSMQMSFRVEIVPNRRQSEMNSEKVYENQLKTSFKKENVQKKV